MKKYRHELLQEIQHSLNLKQGQGESEESYNFRSIYSALGKLTLSSLYDHQSNEEQKAVSDVRLQTKMNQILEGYQRLFPEYHELLVPELWKEIKDRYLKMGFIIKTKYYSQPTFKQVENFKKVIFVRGAASGEKMEMSGLGTFLSGGKEGELADFRTMFRLQEVNFSNLYHHYSKQNFTEKRTEILKDASFLQVPYRLNKAWWTDEFNQQIPLNLVRTNNFGVKNYFLDNQERMLSLPTEVMADRGYNGLRLAILQHHGQRLIFKYHEAGTIIALGGDFTGVPKNEADFIKIYSWPMLKNRKYLKNWVLMDKKIFQALKEHLVGLGYEFERK